MVPYDETTYELAQQLWDKAAGQLRAAGFDVPDRKPDAPEAAQPRSGDAVSADPQQDAEYGDDDDDGFGSSLVVSGGTPRLVVPVIDEGGTAGWTVLTNGLKVHTFDVDPGPPEDADRHDVLVTVDRAASEDADRRDFFVFRSKFEAVRHARLMVGDGEVRVAASPPEASSPRTGHRRVQKPAG